ncbi:MAG: 1-(5-phosphoribosyl)-5-[(5-phosphoribosylamino)methylideneamino]imidazole-4-carboxamide isomerase [Planctomycetes bacterium]|nr:1-(5-phosphoribosyl)-5-[(5-phosphoribosylamino)methylideneamino]imidazole-4-carboxamide isomerase [Planctomycetota bacterium]
MIILPAIDLRDGKCVRLIQGQYDSQITYKDDPAAQAAEFEADGATWLHVVDLDGAKEGKPVNTQSIEAIVRQTHLNVEVGGGLRDEASIKILLEMGVKRVIIGTRAVSDYDWFCDMARTFKGQIVLGLDARGANVSTHGWLEDSQLTILDFATQSAALPLAAIIYTDISKDGMLCGPNIERTQAVAEAVDIPVIASGGVSKIEDIQDLLKVPCIHGVIAGRSLYEGTLDLKAAIDLAGEG